MEQITSGDLESGWQPPAPDQGLESFLFFKYASCCSQFVSIMDRVRMQFKGSLVNPL